MLLIVWGANVEGWSTFTFHVVAISSSFHVKKFIVFVWLKSKCNEKVSLWKNVPRFIFQSTFIFTHVLLFYNPHWREQTKTA